MSYSTGVQQEVNMPVFNETFQVPIPETKLSYKTLQVQVWCVQEDGDEECLVSCNCIQDTRAVLREKVPNDLSRCHTFFWYDTDFSEFDVDYILRKSVL